MRLRKLLSSKLTVPMKQNCQWAVSVVEPSDQRLSDRVPDFPKGTLSKDIDYIMEELDETGDWWLDLTTCNLQWAISCVPRRHHVFHSEIMKKMAGSHAPGPAIPCHQQKFAS